MEDSKGTTYIRMLLDVLVKKEMYLGKLLDLTMAQEDLLKQSTFDEIAFFQLVEQKDEILNKISEIDQGFQSIYNRVAEVYRRIKSNIKSKFFKCKVLLQR